MRDQLRALSPDVALIQEALGQGERDQAQELAEGWAEAVFAPVRARGRGVQGNAVLTRLPVSGWDALDASTNGVERRALIHVELRWHGAPLHVVNMHLGLTHGGRALQVARLGALIAGWVPATAPLVVGGDSNDWRGAAAAAFASLGLVEAHTVLHGRAARTYPAWLPRLRLDRIYLRGLVPAQAAALGGSLSDHLPVIVDAAVVSRPAQ